MLVPVQYREYGYGLSWSPLTDALGIAFLSKGFPRLNLTRAMTRNQELQR